MGFWWYVLAQVVAAGAQTAQSLHCLHHLSRSLTRWVLVHQPCKALGSCGGREGTVAGATQCQQFPEQPFLLRNYHLRETGGVFILGPQLLPFSAHGARYGSGQDGAQPGPFLPFSSPTYVAG